MKIGIYLEGSPEMGGGFFQSLKSCLLLFDIKKYSNKIELIITNKKTKEYLIEKKLIIDYLNKINYLIIFLNYLK